MSLTCRHFILAMALPLAILLQGFDTFADDRLTAEVLPGTGPLKMTGDIASRMVAEVDQFLLNELKQSPGRREQHWRPTPKQKENFDLWLNEKRSTLAKLTGVVENRITFKAPRNIQPIGSPRVIAETSEIQILAVSWPVLDGVTGEGLLVLPTQKPPVANIIYIPDADQTPEEVTGLKASPNSTPNFTVPYPLAMARNGYSVLIPSLISRQMEPRNGRATMTHREFLYRSAFVLGRHIVGYEVQKVLAGVDWYDRESPDRPIGVVGWGEGGMLALLCSALDHRIDVTAVSGFFDSRSDVWQQPIDRNLFGLLEQFGDAELAAMIAPRALIIEAAKGPEVILPSSGGAPGQLKTPPISRVKRETERAEKLIRSLGLDSAIQLVISGSIDSNDNGTGQPWTNETMLTMHQQLKLESDFDTSLIAQPQLKANVSIDTDRRLRAQMSEIDRFNQRLLTTCAATRTEFMSKIDTSTLDAFVESQVPYRNQFSEEVIGRFDYALLPPRARSRKAYETEKWVGYEVIMDVYENLFSYGVLLVPKDIKPNERRPVVVCQHGLEGRPQDTITGDHRAYHDYAAKLADRGFITFAPQNIYIFKDRFRTLQRKANPLKKTLFSVMVPQHQQIVNWLSGQSFVDPDRIGFYGLSYGGKSAMRIPALVPEYCLSICSADFNEWVWKNASTLARQSYVWTGEYEIFEFNLGHTFNYAEMATLIAPRPFMVERGHFDGVAPDETVAYEFAKVRNLYAASLRLPDRCEIEWFVGPHTINGQGSFEFLHKHLSWPQPKKIEPR